MKALLNAAHEVIKDPSAEMPKKRLAKNVGDMKNSVKAASDAIKSAPVPIFEITPSQEVNTTFEAIKYKLTFEIIKNI